MPKDPSANYYQNNKERLQKKKPVEDIKVFLKMKKSDNMVRNDTKIYQKRENKSLSSIEKTIIK